LKLGPFDFNIKIFDPQIFGVVCLCAPVFENMYFRFFIRFQKVTFSFLPRDDMHPQY